MCPCWSLQFWAQVADTCHCCRALCRDLRSPVHFPSPQPMNPGPGNQRGACQTRRPGVGRREGMKSHQQSCKVDEAVLSAGDPRSIFSEQEGNECGRKCYKRCLPSFLAERLSKWAGQNKKDEGAVALLPWELQRGGDASRCSHDSSSGAS